MLTIHVWPRWVKEFLLTHPLYKSPHTLIRYNAVSQIGKASCRGGESRFEERRTGNGKGGKSEGRRNDP